MAKRRRKDEAGVKKHIKETLNLIPRDKCMWWMPVMGEFGAAGKGDFVACIEGRYVCIEAKDLATDKPTTRQKLHHDEVRRAGGTVMILHHGNMEAFRQVVVDGLKQGKLWP